MRILLVEDNRSLNASLRYQLELDGFCVDSCTDGSEALFLIEQRIHDVILLDRMLPSLDGIEVLKRLRGEQIAAPVILITALGELEDKVSGLNLGADDYLVKPFAYEELLARIHCIARRPRSLVPQDSLTYGDIVYYPAKKLLQGPLRDCRLSKREGALLETLLRNRKQIVTRDILISRVWGPDNEVEDGNLDNYIFFLRRRLRAVTVRVGIKTIRGVGYQLEDQCTEESPAAGGTSETEHD